MVNFLLVLPVKFFFKTSSASGNHGSGTTESTEDTGSGDSSGGGWLSSITDWLNSIIAKIASLSRG